MSEEQPRMRQYLMRNLPVHLHKRLKVMSLVTGKTMESIILEALETHIDEWQDEINLKNHPKNQSQESEQKQVSSNE